jgi:hypothetical protein
MGDTVETGTVGGGAAVPVGEDFATFLQGLLQSGQFGNVPQISPELRDARARREEFANSSFGQSGPGRGLLEKIDANIAELESQQQNIGAGAIDQTQGFAQALNDIISGPDVTGQQSAVQEIIRSQSERDVADIRERFTAGGGSQGTPSAVSEGLFRSELAPKLATATGQLDLAASQQQLQALIPILQTLSGFAGRGIPQAQPFVQVKEGLGTTLGGLAGGAAGFAAGGPIGASVGSSVGSSTFKGKGAKFFGG